MFLVLPLCLWMGVKEHGPQILHRALEVASKVLRQAEGSEARRLPSQLQHSLVEAGESRQVTERLERAGLEVLTPRLNAPASPGAARRAASELNSSPHIFAENFKGVAGIKAGAESHGDEEQSYAAANLEFLNKKAQDYANRHPAQPSMWQTTLFLQRQAAPLEFAAPRPDYKVLAIISEPEGAYTSVVEELLAAERPWDEKHLGQMFGRLENSHVAEDISFNRAALFNYIRKNPDASPLIIIVHSVAGRTGRSIVLPGGERVASASIYRACRAANSQCKILTCYGPDFGLRSKVSLRRAYQMVRRGTQLLDLLSREPNKLPKSLRAALADGSMTSTDLMVDVMRQEGLIRKAGNTTIIAGGAYGGYYGGHKFFSAYVKGNSPK